MFFPQFVGRLSLHPPSNLMICCTADCTHTLGGLVLGGLLVQIELGGNMILHSKSPDRAATTVTHQPLRTTFASSLGIIQDIFLQSLGSVGRAVLAIQTCAVLTLFDFILPNQTTDTLDTRLILIAI
jgi:hypothetical protein